MERERRAREQSGRVHSRGFARSLLGALVLVTASLACILGLWWGSENSEITHARTAALVSAEQYALRLESWVAARAAALEYFAETWVDEYAASPEAYARDAGRVAETFAGFQAINFIDAEGVIRTVVPFQSNEAALGRSILEHPEVGPREAIARARSAGRLTSTAPLSLLQGGAGFASYLPILDTEGELLGYINGVFRLDGLVGSVLSEPEISRDFRLTIGVAGNDVEHVLEEQEGRSLSGMVIEVPFDVMGSTWQLTLVPTRDFVLDRKTLADEILVGVGILLTFLLGAAVLAIGRRQQELALSEEKYRILVEHQSDLVVKVDAEGRFLFVSPSYCKTMGKSESELLGKALIPLVHEEDRAQSVEAMRGLQDPPHHVHLEQRAMTTEGWRWFSWVHTALLSAEGEVEAVIGVGRDITERKRLEERLRHSEKMEAVGQLAGGVAHDFNNALQIILGHLDLARDVEGKESDLPAAEVSVIRGAAERASELTRQLLAFSRRQVLKPADLDANTVVGEMLGLMEKVIGENVKVVFEGAEGLPAVHADRRQLEQIVANLAVNARDAMPRGGTLRVRTSLVDVAQAELEDSDESEAGPHVLLAFEDDGIGMSDEVRLQVFEPFFTTKKTGEGTGLGLATVYGIVRQHDGFLRVRSAPGEGSVFEVYLPALDRPADQQGSEHAVDTERGQGSVLVVEDDVLVRSVTARMLKSAGYEVFEAESGEAALAAFETLAPRVDLALLDIVMPGMSGLELAERLRERRPDLSVLFVSGYSADSLRARSLFDEGMDLLQKPFARDALISRVQQLLARVSERE